MMYIYVIMMNEGVWIIGEVDEKYKKGQKVNWVGMPRRKEKKLL